MTWIASLTIAAMMVIAFTAVYIFGPVIGGVLTIAFVGAGVLFSKFMLKRIGNPDDVYAMERAGITPPIAGEAAARETPRQRPPSPKARPF